MALGWALSCARILAWFGGTNKLSCGIAIASVLTERPVKLLVDLTVQKSEGAQKCLVI